MTVAEEPLWPWDGVRQCDAPLPLSWPGGALVAVWPVLNVESFLPGSGGPAIQPHLAAAPEIANSGWRDYGNTAGVARLARLFADLGLPASAAVNGDILTRAPRSMATVIDVGWEVIGHGASNSTGHAGMCEDEERAAIVGTLDALTRATGARPRGWLTPGFSVTPRTPTLLVEAGLAYTADRTDGDTPALWRTKAGTLAALPYSLETNDFSLCLVARHNPEQFASALRDYVTQLAREARPGHPLLVAFGLHTFIAGQPARTLHLGRALEQIAALPGVCFMTGSEVCAALPAWQAEGMKRG